MVLKYVLQLSLIWFSLVFMPIVILLAEILPNSSLSNWTPSEWFYRFTFLLSVINNFLEPLLLEFDTYDQIVSLVTLITYQNLINYFALLWRPFIFWPSLFHYYLLRFSVQSAFFGKTSILYHLMENIFSWQLLS